MSHNVPAVYDVFAARIRALRSKDQGCKPTVCLSALPKRHIQPERYATCDR
jgi:hypothetical protein